MKRREPRCEAAGGVPVAGVRHKTRRNSPPTFGVRLAGTEPKGGAVTRCQMLMTSSSRYTVGNGSSGAPGRRADASDRRPLVPPH